MAKSQRPRRKYLINKRFQVRWSLLIALCGAAPVAIFAGFMWVSLDEYNMALRGATRDQEQAREVLLAASALLAKTSVESDKSATPLSAELNRIAAIYSSSRSTRQNIIATNEIAQSLVMITPVVVLVLLWVCGVFVTHKVAGPLHVVKAQLEAYAKHGVIQRRPLRDGDEFQEVYDSLVGALGGEESPLAHEGIQPRNAPQGARPSSAR